MSYSYYLLYLSWGLLLGFFAGRYFEARRWKKSFTTEIDPLFSAIRRECEELEAVCRYPLPHRDLSPPEPSCLAPLKKPSPDNPWS